MTDEEGSTVGFSDNGNGTITIDPSQYDALGGGEVAVLTISNQLSDGTTTTPNTGILTVEGVEDPIVIAGDSEGAVAEDSDLVDSGSHLASDADVGDNPSFTPQTGTAGSYGNFDIDADGYWTYTLDDSLARQVAGDEVAIDSFTVEATIADGEATTETVSIEVNGEDESTLIAQTIFFEDFEDPTDGRFGEIRSLPDGGNFLFFDQNSPLPSSESRLRATHKPYRLSSSSMSSVRGKTPQGVIRTVTASTYDSMTQR